MNPRELPWRCVIGADETQLLLVRHGQTEWNAQRRFLGRSDIPLDEIGRAQAAELGKWLADPARPLYSSPALRALQTASTLGGEPVEKHGLAELDQGELEGLDGPTALGRYREFFAAWEQDPTHVRIPGGETLAECADRARTSIARLVQQHRGEQIAVVTHQMVIASLLTWARDQPLREWRSARVRNTSVTVLVGSDAGLRELTTDWTPWAR